MRYLYASLLWAAALFPAFGQSPPVLSIEDKKEIRGEARKIIESHLNDLLNSIASNGIGEVGRRAILYDSFMPNESQIFSNNNVIVEDDINPEFTISKAGYPDLKIQLYLENLNLMYTKSENYSIKFTEIFVTDVMQGPNSLYVLVHYKSHFTNTNKNRPNVKYAPVNRTAELSAEKINNQWKVLITGIRYYKEPPKGTPVAKAPVKPADAPTAKPTATPTTKPATEPAKQSGTKIPPAPVKTEQAVAETKPQEKTMGPSNPPAERKEPVTKAAEKSPELVPERTAKGSRELDIKAEKYRKQSLLYRAGAGVAVVGAVATFFVLNSSYGEYKSDIEQNNTTLETWWNATDANGRTNGQNFGSIDTYKAQPKSIAAFGTPGIYVAGAAILGGAVLWIVGSGSSRKAKDLRSQTSLKNIYMSPQASLSHRYAGLTVRYKF